MYEVEFLYSNFFQNYSNSKYFKTNPLIFRILLISVLWTLLQEAMESRKSNPMQSKTSAFFFV